VRDPVASTVAPPRSNAHDRDRPLKLVRLKASDIVARNARKFSDGYGPRYNAPTTEHLN
jgi:hypothetical protein